MHLGFSAFLLDISTKFWIRESSSNVFNCWSHIYLILITVVPQYLPFVDRLPSNTAADFQVPNMFFLVI